MNCGNPNRRNNHKGGAPRGVSRRTEQYETTWRQLGELLQPTLDELRVLLGDDFEKYQAWKQRKNQPKTMTAGVGA